MPDSRQRGSHFKECPQKGGSVIMKIYSRKLTGIGERANSSHGGCNSKQEKDEGAGR